MNEVVQYKAQCVANRERAHAMNRGLSSGTPACVPHRVPACWTLCAGQVRSCCCCRFGCGDAHMSCPVAVCEPSSLMLGVTVTPQHMLTDSSSLVSSIAAPRTHAIHAPLSGRYCAICGVSLAARLGKAVCLCMPAARLNRPHAWFPQRFACEMQATASDLTKHGLRDLHSLTSGIQCMEAWRLLSPTQMIHSGETMVGAW